MRKIQIPNRNGYFSTNFLKSTLDPDRELKLPAAAESAGGLPHSALEQRPPPTSLPRQPPPRSLSTARSPSLNAPSLASQSDRHLKPTARC